MKASYLLSSAIIASSLLLTACDNDDDPKRDSQLRITHASPDASAVNIYINGQLRFADVDYKDSTGILALPKGTRSIEVRGIMPDGSELSVIGPVDVTTSWRERLDVIAYDDVLSGGNLNIKAKVISTEIERVDQVAVTVLHAAPDVADVDIYVTAPNDPIAGASPINTGFGQNTDAITLMANTDYRIRITGDNSPTVVYDSGTLNFPAGTELLLAAVENTTGIGANPVNLLAVDRTGASEVLDQNTTAEVRVVHNSADTPAVDVLVDGNELLDAVTFPNASNYDDIAAPTGQYNVVVAEDPGNTLTPIDVDLDLEAGMSYTAYAIGGLNSVTDETLEALLTVDDRRTVATEARVRVVHGSYAVAENIPVDVYLTATQSINGASPAIVDLAYGEFTDQLAVPEGDYYITVTAANDASTVALSTGPVTLSNANNYTVIARDPGTGEVGAPLIQATLLNE